jgi:hypothetical protein
VAAAAADEGVMTSLPAKDEVSIGPRVAVRSGAVRQGTRRTSLRYWVCLSVLVLAAGGLKTAASWFGWFIRKEAVPLKRPLQQMDVRELGPRYELDKVAMDKMEPMSEDMQESLGTKEYVQLCIKDTQKAADDPTRVALLFVTYYTGRPDMVPHVPDECYLAGGYDKISEATRSVRVPGCGAPNDEVPLRVLEFEGRRNMPFSVGGDAVTVIYFFHVNNRYATTRNGVRASMLNPLQRYAYYAKVEVTFTNGSTVRAGREASVAATGPLLARVLPVLFKDHFDLEKFAPAANVSVPAGD